MHSNIFALVAVVFSTTIVTISAQMQPPQIPGCSGEYMKLYHSHWREAEIHMESCKVYPKTIRKCRCDNAIGYTNAVAQCTGFGDIKAAHAAANTIRATECSQQSSGASIPVTNQNVINNLSPPSVSNAASTIKKPTNSTSSSSSSSSTSSQKLSNTTANSSKDASGSDGVAALSSIANAVAAKSEDIKDEGEDQHEVNTSSFITNSQKTSTAGINVSAGSYFMAIGAALVGLVVALF